MVLGRLTFAVEIFSGDDWVLLEDGVKECQCEWTDPDPSRQYYVRVTASNDFGSGAASRSTMVAEQVGEEYLDFENLNLNFESLLTTHHFCSNSRYVFRTTHDKDGVTN